jgi:HAD superfamily hydrolase (TIGR01548 family)
MKGRAGLQNFDAVVFDLDGVLIDTSRSFTVGVLRTAALCAVPPGLGEGWDAAHVEELRLCEGFNDDWDAAAALALVGPAAGPGAGWPVLCRELRQSGGGPRSVIRRTGEQPWRVMRAVVGPVFQRLYAGPEARRVYGVPATEARGLYESEVPLIQLHELESLDVPWGVFTGRSPGEAALGLRILGVRLPRERLICATDSRYRKPRPDGLLQLAASLRATRVAFVGDNLDDLMAARNARDAGLEVAFLGIAPEGSVRERRFLEGGAVAVVGQVRDLWRELARKGGS